MKQIEKEKLTRGTKELFKQVREAVAETDPESRNNIYKLTERVADILEERHTKAESGDGVTAKEGSMDYQLTRMGLTTTKQIMAKLTSYIIANASTK